ncbi:MAG TPA: endonuclease/exonuclease/phosphatase family protein, partial [Candidatus Polarisedimenticolia bacterium]|nr:endonuclease/exonuclease/phosphatase family protein [Candidatus Polarisedimenticolia bacterium]
MPPRSHPSRPMPWVPLPLVVLAAGLLATALLPGTDRLDAAPTQVTARLRVMNLNIFYGGDELNLQNGNFCVRADGCPETLALVVEEIRRADPDVVGIEEGEHNACAIAQALGWNCSARMQIISRLPLIDPPGGDGVYLFVQIAPGKVVAMMNVHLPSDPYGPYVVRDGGTADEVHALETSVRLPAIQEQLAALPGLLRAGIPVFLTGDFNSPSHHDWTTEVAAVRPEVRFPFDWPVSRALADAGFFDPYRVVHPDPIAVPGFTWSPGGPETVTNDVWDRIDWVLAAGNAVPIASTVVGEVGFPDAGVTIDPYPTDHRGVLSTFDVTPGTSPILVAVGSRRVFAGETLMVTFHARGRNGEAVAIVPAGGTAGAAIVRRPTGGATDGTFPFGTSSLAPGAYEAALLDSAGSIVSRSPFWLYA